MSAPFSDYATDTLTRIRSVQRGGRVEIIANDQGHRITPSWVSFTDEERLVGDAAKNAYHSNPENTVFDAKRLIGRKVDDPEVKRDQVHWPFKITKKNGKPVIEVTYKGEQKQFVRRRYALLRNSVLTYFARPPRRFLPWFWAR